MTPKDVVIKWVDTFNKAGTESLANFYSENAINHQVNTSPLEGKEAIQKCLRKNLQEPTWYVLLKIFLKMVNGPY
jgi:ketosteroid isomerase-like protein